MLKRLLALLLMMATAGASAQSGISDLQEPIIDIIGNNERAYEIAVVPFGWDGPGPAPVDLAAVINGDLSRSGVFKPMRSASLPERPVGDRDINFRVWRKQTDYLVVGKLLPAQQAGRYVVQFRLFDVLKRDEKLGLGGTQLTGLQFDRAESELRNTAHDISDRIYEAITGNPGAFNTRIAYITEHKKSGKKNYALKIADSDGFNATSVLNSTQPIMSPTWSPDGARLAYVSFEGRRASIYLQDLATGTRQKISAFPGINGAPAFAPDGTRMALTLSKDGNPEIYILHLRSRKLTRLTSNPAIDTEPSWSPDGRNIIFTSDRSGGPQIYRVSANGGDPKRITFQGNYNAGSSFAPNGRQIVMVHNDGGGYRIAVMDVDSQDVKILTKNRLDDSPSYSPNGAMVLYSTTGKNGAATLAAVTTDGRFLQILPLKSGGLVRDPAWAPSR